MPAFLAPLLAGAASAGGVAGTAAAGAGGGLAAATAGATAGSSAAAGAAASAGRSIAFQAGKVGAQAINVKVADATTPTNFAASAANNVGAGLSNRTGQRSPMMGQSGVQSSSLTEKKAEYT